VRGREAVDPLVDGDEVDAVSVACGANAEGVGHLGLVGDWGCKKNYFLLLSSRWVRWRLWLLDLYRLICFCYLQIVRGCKLRRRHVVESFVEPDGVEQVDPRQCCERDVIGILPRSGIVGQVGHLEAVDRLGQSVTVQVADGPDGWATQILRRVLSSAGT